MAKVTDAPQNARSRRTGAALLTATRELIEESGFAALTMPAVAARAGISRRGIYLHYSTRTELLTALYRSLGTTENLAASLQKVWDSPDGVTGLEEWAAHIARSHPRIQAVLAAVEQAAQHDQDAEALWATTQRNWRTGSRRVIQRLADENRLAPHWNVEVATDLLWGLMSLDLLDRLHRQCDWSRERLAGHLTAMLRATFVA